MKKILFTALVTAALLPQASFALVINDTFPFIHPLMKSEREAVLTNTVNAETTDTEERTQRNLPLDGGRNRNALTLNSSNDNTNLGMDRKSRNINTAAGETVLLQRLGERLQVVVTSQLKKISTLRTKIASQSHMNAEMQATILSDLDADAGFFAEQQAALDNAETVADLRSIGEDIKGYLTTRAERLEGRKAELNNSVRDAAEKAERVGESIVAKLQKISLALEGHDIDTTQLNAQIDTLAQDVTALSEVDTTNGPDVLRSAITDIREKIHDSITTVKTLVKKT